MHLRHLIAYALLVFAMSHSFGQVTGTIKGKIYDAATNEVLPLASVFLASTMNGTTSGKDGNFTINGIAIGKYELIVSMLGYELKSIPVVVTAQPVTLDIPLRQQAKYLKEFTVRSKHEHRKRYESEFKTYFIGLTRNSRRCLIKNLDQVMFEEDKKVLTATCAEPLIIENRALGYRIYYFLQKFEVDYNFSRCIYSGVARFEDLPLENPSDAKRRDDERKRAYYGSLMHLMRSLKFHCLSDDSFELASNCPGKSETPISYESLFKTNSDSTIFSDCLLKVVYRDEPPEEGYPVARSRDFRPQISYLTLRDRRLTIYDNGYYERPLRLEMDGYFGWSEKIAELLPYEYYPPPVRKK